MSTRRKFSTASGNENLVDSWTKADELVRAAGAFVSPKVLSNPKHRIKDAERILIVSSFTNRFDHFLRGISHCVTRDERESGFRQSFLARGDIVSFEPHH